VVDIVQILTQQPDPTTARKYWNKLKQRLGKEGSQLVTDCHQLKMLASDGKNYLTDAATAETLLRLVQSVPSPKAEPINCGLPRWDTSDAGDVRSCLALARTREVGVTGPQREVDHPAHDRSGDPQQADRLLGTHEVKQDKSSPSSPISFTRNGLEYQFRTTRDSKVWKARICATT